MEFDLFKSRYPVLYYMAKENTWPSIQTYGLLSTSAILDLHAITGEARGKYERLHRPAMMKVSSDHAPEMILRDQKPMAPAKLLAGLRNNITPTDWYYFLNQKAFLWATRERLERLLKAREYRGTTHDILSINTATFADEYQNSIMLSHMNSGNAFPVAHMRDYSIFKSIADYPVKPNGNPIKEVAEVTIQGSIPNIAQHVIKVESMKG